MFWSCCKPAAMATVYTQSLQSSNGTLLTLATAALAARHASSQLSCCCTRQARLGALAKPLSSMSCILAGKCAVLGAPSAGNQVFVLQATTC